MKENNPYFYTVSVAAKQLQVNPVKLRRWMHNGLINFVCLTDRTGRHKYLIKQETINEIIVQGIVQRELERTYEQEAQEEYERYIEWGDREQDIL